MNVPPNIFDLTDNQMIYIYNTTKQWKPKVLVDRPEWMRNLQENFVLEKLQHWRNASERRDSCVDQKSTEINQSHQLPFSVGMGAWAHCGRTEATTVVTQDNGVLSHFAIKLSPFVIPVTLCNNSCRLSPPPPPSQNLPSAFVCSSSLI